MNFRISERLERWRRLDAQMHPLDRLIASLGSPRLFNDGWGEVRFLDDSFLGGMPLASTIDAPSMTWLPTSKLRRHVQRDGFFESPRADLPLDVLRARVRWLSGLRGRGHSACIVLAGSRDETFALRTHLFAPLVREGIDIFILENPFYGERRPAGQEGAWLRTVHEHILMNIATVEEARALVSHAERSQYERVAVAGYSMGGYMAALVAAVTPRPVGVAVLAAGASPAPVFTSGAHARSIDFAKLGGAPEHASSARERLAGVFDSARISRLSPPVKPSAAIVLACTRDGFIPQAETQALHAHWTGSELRTVNAGHISAFFTHASALRSAVRDAVMRAG